MHDSGVSLQFPLKVKVVLNRPTVPGFGPVVGGTRLGLGLFGHLFSGQDG
jgi:hypothetical protein